MNSVTYQTLTFNIGHISFGRGGEGAGEVGRGRAQYSSRVVSISSFSFDLLRGAGRGGTFAWRGVCMQHLNNRENNVTLADNS